MHRISAHPGKGGFAISDGVGFPSFSPLQTDQRPIAIQEREGWRNPSQGQRYMAIRENHMHHREKRGRLGVTGPLIHGGFVLRRPVEQSNMGFRTKMLQ